MAFKFLSTLNSKYSKFCKYFQRRKYCRYRNWRSRQSVVLVKLAAAAPCEYLTHLTQAAIRGRFQLKIDSQY